MAQLFDRGAALGVKLAFLGLALLAFAVLALWTWRVRSYDPQDEPVAQVIPFSHKHHVGDDGIDCRYCHTTVETSAHAGLPSTGVCLGCHSQLYTDQRVLAPLRRSAATGQPLRWRRVHQLPDFVYFQHAVHVAKGVPCAECHGRVDQMPLTWRVASLKMQWCLDCHRNPAPHLRPHAEVFAMGLPPLAPGEGERLARAAGLHDTRRLTDCSTCHR
ncbi:MAG: cytochrome c3 family protein [Rhizobacter sp.]|nr:cytochrome c3 family protein [Rhizobacter sp.]